MKGFIDIDEWYPVYEPVTDPIPKWVKPYEIPDELIERYEKAKEEFSKVQDELKAIRDRANPRIFHIS